MFKPLALYIGLRYTRTKRRNGFISFISLSSMLGIALGIAVLITVLSVMNGFDLHMHERIFSLSPAVTINAIDNKLDNWEALANMVQTRQKKVLATAPFVRGEGLMRFNGNVQPSILWGVLSQQEEKMNELNKMMRVGQLADLKSGSFRIILGQVLANNLSVSIGDKVTLIIPRVTVTPAGVMPVFKRFTVVGLFCAGSGFGFDSRFAYININDAQKLFLLGEAVSGINLKIADRDAAPAISKQLQSICPHAYVSDWTQQYGAFFNAIQLEKTMMFLILTLIIAVAAFNLISTLVMVVTDKRADIAILRTLGATPKIIMQIFIIQGTVIGLMGTLLGLVSGILLALNVTQVVNGLETLLCRQLFSPAIYFLDNLPSKLMLGDVVKVCTIALVLSMLSTLYPAWKASRIQPAEALRYE